MTTSAYAPTGASWTVNGTSITSTLAGKNYFTVAVLPTTADSDSDPDRAGRPLTAATPTRTSPAPRSATATPRHQHGEHHLRLHHRPPGRAPRPGPSSRSTRTSGRSLVGGTPIAPDLRLAARADEDPGRRAASSRTSMTLPRGAARGAGRGHRHRRRPGDPDQLPRRRSPATRWPSRSADTYWTGKGLGRAARIAEIADQVGDTATRDSGARRRSRATLTELAHRLRRRDRRSSSTTTRTGGP